MKFTAQWLVAALLGISPLLALAQDAASTSSSDLSQPLKGATDAETGLSTRAWLKEQAEGINRGEVEAYRAESAGKAFRAYSDAIGSTNQPAPVSQVSTITTN